jgi:hypothetical protein
MSSKLAIIGTTVAALLIPAVATYAQQAESVLGGRGGGAPPPTAAAPGPGTAPRGPAVAPGGGPYVNRGFNRDFAGGPGPGPGGPVVGRSYHGGIWYGPRRHYWRGQWYAYGVGRCWMPSPIGYVWICG